MKHKVFVAINLPKDFKELLFNYQSNHQDVPAKWTAKENLHITAVFIGNVDDRYLSQLHKLIESVIKKQKRFVISFKNIDYSLDKAMPPRMIWAIGDISKEFALLKRNLEEAILTLPIIFNPEIRETIPHITLARVNGWVWQGIEPEERPTVQEFINFEVPVDSVELLESILKKTGPEYKILESYKL